jgi:hypothetical protein
MDIVLFYQVVPRASRKGMPAPAATNEVWSIDFFDRTAVAHVLKRLTGVDDATHKAVAIEIERSHVAA